jgi:hypothetical protein
VFSWLKILNVYYLCFFTLKTNSHKQKLQKKTKKHECTMQLTHQRLAGSEKEPTKNRRKISAVLNLLLFLKINLQ